MSGNLDGLVPAVREGMVGMHVGGQRRIHGSWNQGLSLLWLSQPEDKVKYGVPQKTGLVYDVELFAVRSRLMEPERPAAAPAAEPAAPAPKP